MNYQDIIDEYYPEDGDLKRLLLKHSRQVADRSIEISNRHPELRIDREFVEEAAMLHDIGIRWCDAPGICCNGTEPYIRHGLIGGELLRHKGLVRHAQVCERHTGTGLTREQIERQQLPLPLPPPTSQNGSGYAPTADDEPYVPHELEEKVVCYADKFYSKSHPERVLTVAQAAQSLERFGHRGVRIFLEWAAMFE